MNEKYIIKQLSIFSENKTGKLAAIAKVFQDSGVSLQAFSIAEANNFGVVRAIVDNPEVAFNAFANKNYALKYTDVLAIKMRDVAGGLYEVASLLDELDINIEYAYSLRSGEYSALIVKVADINSTVEKIKNSPLLELLPAKDCHF